jgi:hypothetical protein
MIEVLPFEVALTVLNHLAWASVNAAILPSEWNESFA